MSRINNLQRYTLCLLSKGSQVRVLSGAPKSPIKSITGEAQAPPPVRAKTLQTEEKLRNRGGLLRLAVMALCLSSATPAATLLSPPDGGLWGLTNGLGYLRYGHIYGGEWPEDIPRFVGCDDPWFISQQEHWRLLNCDGNCPGFPDSSPDPTTPAGEEVPEPATLALVAAALTLLAVAKERRRQ